jgi:hypothetical protein
MQDLARLQPDPVERRMASHLVPVVSGELPFAATVHLPPATVEDVQALGLRPAAMASM